MHFKRLEKVKITIHYMPLENWLEDIKVAQVIETRNGFEFD